MFENTRKLLRYMIISYVGMVVIQTGVYGFRIINGWTPPYDNYLVVVYVLAFVMPVGVLAKFPETRKGAYREFKQAKNLLEFAYKLQK